MPANSVCLFLLLVLFVPSLQQKTANEQRDPSYELWLVRAQTFTDELVKDAANLEPSQRSILLAKLAQRWWRDDPEKAKSWMTGAVVYVEAVPNKENAEDRRKRINTARQLLQILASLDKKFSLRLVELLKEADKQSGADERSGNAEALLDAALSVVDSDPVRAAELGAAALRVDHSSNVDTLVLALRPQNAKLADVLLAQALALARQKLETQLLMNITRAIYPAEMQINTQTASPPEALRAELLHLDLAYLRENPINSDTRNSVCIGVISFILPVLTEFDRRLPQQAPAVRQAVHQCQSLSPLAQQRIDDALRPEPLNTINDLLKAAENSEDVKVKTVYAYRAATLAKEKKDYDGALAILDDMNAEEREFMSGMWQFFRWDWASLSAVEQYNRSDFSAVRNTIAAVPDDLKAFAKLAFVDRLPNKRSREADPSLEFINEAHKELASSYGSENDRYPWYFALLRLTIRYAPADAPAILSEAIAALNRVAQADEKGVRTEVARSYETSGFWKMYAGSLIDMDEYVVKEAVGSVSSRKIRVAVRLELLQACLERMRAARG